MKKKLILLLSILLPACSLFGEAAPTEAQKRSAASLNKPLGISVLEFPKFNAISLKIKFQCVQDGNKEADQYKIKVFQYKIKVTEGDKEILTEGVQRNWLEPNVSVLNLKYPKNRPITFKSLEISSHTWVKSFSELQLGSPLALTLQQCKDLAPY